MPLYELTKGTIYHGGRYIRAGGIVEMTEEEAASTTKVKRVTVLLEETNPPADPVQPTAPPESEPEAEQAQSEPTDEPEQTPEHEAVPEAEPEQESNEAETPKPEQPTTNKKGKK